MGKINLIMPMAGYGSRFQEQGYNYPKPLIEINGYPFFYWSTQSIRNFINLESLIFVVLQEHIDKYQIDEKIKKYFPEAIIQSIPTVLNGALLTCLEGVKKIQNNLPILFNDCDHMFCCNMFNEFCKQGDFEYVDGALLTFFSDESKYSFLEYNKDGNVIRTVEKEVISNDAICGAYYFKNKKLFLESAELYLIKCCYKEYFVSGVYNEMAKKEKKILGFKTDFHIPFGIPEEYEKAKLAKEFNKFK